MPVLRRRGRAVHELVERLAAVLTSHSRGAEAILEADGNPVTAVADLMAQLGPGDRDGDAHV